MPPVNRLSQAPLAERYLLDREIGRGGMATVYLAHDLRHDREVAVKVLAPELSMSLGADRFLREIKLIARLQHPHILPLYDSGESDGLLFYVMPYIAGNSLRAHLTREQSLPIEDAVRLAREMASALDYAHRTGVVHRDIKPENILLQDGRAIIADFGVARVISTATDAGLTHTGLAIGTPAYMSPEQAVGDREVDGRSDIYALGCVLFEMLAGSPPFTGPTAQAVIASRFKGGPPGVRRVRGSVPEALEQTLLRAMAPEPVDRFQSAADLIAALERPSTSVDSTTSSTSRSQLVSSIGVLPFASLTADPDGEVLGDGLTEELIGALSTLHGVRVASRSSSLALKGRREDVRTLGERLNVVAVLEGSVRKVGGRVRVAAQLTSISDGYQLWSQSYERDGGDLFAVQDSVAGEIITALRSRLAAKMGVVERAPTADPEALALYDGARRLWVRRSAADMPRAAADLRSAVERDPSFALAHSALAALSLARADVDLSSADASAEAIAAATRAIELDPALGEAHAALGFANSLVWQWRDADAAFERAVECAPRNATVHHWHAIHLAALGRIEEACPAIVRAQELSPDVPVLRLAGGALWWYARNWDRAEADCRKAIVLDLTSAFPHVLLGLVHAARGSYSEAIAEQERALDLLGALHPFPLAALGCVSASAGRAREAGEVLEQLTTLATRVTVSPFHFAAVHAAIGNIDEAFTALDEAYEARDGWLLALRVHPWMDSLRRDDRFAQVLSRMNSDK